MKPQTEPRRPFPLAAAFAALALALAPPALAQHNHDHGSHAPAKARAAQTPIASGQGIVKEIDPEKQRLTLQHGPIAALGWPAMTMPFAIANPALLQGLKAGDEIEFDLKDEQTISAVRRK
ncbi:MAG: copper-binding protein [Candidatus Accumulibacter sp.]|jgi:Cu(I)/Ag(I) efflux system protein CusF|nr:copper-binding protein [Accumulibacter sp.]